MNAGSASRIDARPGPDPLDQQHGLADQGQRGAADQHQVGRAPEGDVLAEEAMPQVVEREAEQREEAREARSGRRPPARTSRG